MEQRDERRPVPALRALGGMLASPGATFASFPARQPWFVPLLLFSLIGAVTAALVASVMANALAPQAADISQQAGLPAAEAGNVAQFVRLLSLVTGTVVGFLSPFFYVFVTALVVWVLAMLLRQRLPFAQVFSLATYAYLPHVFGTLVLTGLVVAGAYDVMAMGGALPTSLKVLFPEATGGFLAGLARRVELFGLWSTVLLGIGLAAATRRTSRWGIGVALAAWLLLVVAGSALGSLVPGPGSWPAATGGAPGLGGGIPR
ncbi:YIP1 family protein [Hydrogenibacillus sp. N12]|uniref:YIP1 family protein n=1 Tax=Hydrogenibacillus sp. N12 TaxID=2866627 RepID=UPI001C7DA165|nr:YIP1 family protein [Hydrogenibacillus sp. N12]QZA32170.1 YIP1 family protein [Hydrogenibacillus sp. N12]